MALLKRKSQIVMSETNIQHCLYKNLYGLFKVMIPNFYADNKFGFESDMLCVRQSGYTVEIEIKISESDFKNDFKKTTRDYDADYITVDMGNGLSRMVYPELTKHDLLQQGRLTCNYFSYAMPMLLAVKVMGDLPEYCGLYGIHDDGSVSTLKEGKLLHKNKISDTKLAGMAQNLCFRYWTLLSKAKNNDNCTR